MSRLSARDLCVSPPAEPGRDAPAEPLVRDFSLELGPGDWVALEGPNGSGKTTLLLALAGLWPARSGSLLFDGEPLGPAAAPRVRSRIAVVLQDPSSQLLQPTVRDELAFTARNLGVDEEETARRLVAWSRRFGLDGDLHRDPQALSAGRQQMVLLAAALIAGPAVLLADEPAAHLDAPARSAALAAIAEEVRAGLAVLWITQDETECAAAGRRVRLGSPTAGGLPRLADAGGTGGDRLEILVGADPGGDGPRVRVEGPMSLRVAKTGVACLEGPNGSGKSVLLAAATGLMDVGQVRVRWSAPPEVAPLLASQYPESEIFEERAVDEVVYAAVARGVPRSGAIERALTQLRRMEVDGPGLLERRVWDLSGGQKRILSLVGALIAPASLLALDEPTAGLDAIRRRGLIGLLGEIARDRSVLVASQDREFVEALGLNRIRLAAPSSLPLTSHSEKKD